MSWKQNFKPRKSKNDLIGRTCKFVDVQPEQLGKGLYAVTIAVAEQGIEGAITDPDGIIWREYDIILSRRDLSDAISFGNISFGNTFTFIQDGQWANVAKI